MTDEWTFPTNRGRATVADGNLRVERSPASILRGAFREKWARSEWKGKALFAVSIFGILRLVVRVVPAVESLVGPGDLTGTQWISLVAVAVVALVIAWRVARTTTLPLDSIDRVERDDTSLTMYYAEDGERTTDELDLPTEAAADDAVETLRLKGVSAKREPPSEDSGTGEYESVRSRRAAETE